MRTLHLFSTLAMLLLIACDPNRSSRPIQVVLTPELVQRQSCQALADAERKPQDEVVITGTAEHGHPDVLRITCDGKARTLIFALASPPDDLGMKQLRKQWQSKTSPKHAECSACPKYNVSARFVGEVSADPADPSRLLFFARTADQIHRKRIDYRK